MIGSVTTVQRNQPAAQVAAKHNIFPQMAAYVTNRMVLVGIEPGHTRLAEGEVASRQAVLDFSGGGRFATPQIPSTDPYSVYRH